MKNNKVLVGLVVILLIIVLLLSGYIVYDKFIKEDNNTNNDNKEEKVSIKLDENLDYVYDANYTNVYQNKYKEFKRDNTDELVSNDNYGFIIKYNLGTQKLSDLKAPYINIKSDYAQKVNDEIKEMYVNSAKEFDDCASDEGFKCSTILTYYTYKYNDILSVVVISGEQVSGPLNLNYVTYNFDLTNGNEVTYKEVIKKLNYNEDTLLDQEKKMINNKMDELYKDADIDLSNSCLSGENKNCYDIANKLLEESINKDTILYFVDNNGNLNIIVVPYFDGAEIGAVAKYVITINK